MKTMKHFVTAFFISLVFIPHYLFATDVGAFYLGAEFGSTQVSGDGPKNDSMFMPSQTFKASDSSYELHTGFQFTDWFAAELSFTDFGSTTDSFKLKDGLVFLVQPMDTQTVDAKAFALSSVFSYAMTPQLSLLGFLGISAVDYEVNLSGGFSPFSGYLSQTNNFSDQGLLYGVGAKYSLNESLAVRTGLRRVEAGDLTFDSLSLGFEYGF